jgi:hypothetical protein
MRWWAARAIPSRCSRWSVEGQTGVNVALGVADLQLRYGR